MVMKILYFHKILKTRKGLRLFGQKGYDDTQNQPCKGHSIALS